MTVEATPPGEGSGYVLMAASVLHNGSQPEPFDVKRLTCEGSQGEKVALFFYDDAADLFLTPSAFASKSGSTPMSPGENRKLRLMVRADESVVGLKLKYD